MVNINISMPEELHKGIKLKCAIHDITLKDYVITTVSDEINKKLNKTITVK